MLIGNECVINSINTMFKTGRLPHAVIIEGEDGTGKHTLAKHIAKGALCTENNPPCNACRNCHLAEIGTHPDISVYPGESKYSIDFIRSVRQEMYLVPHMAQKRVFIFTNAEDISPQAQNALLKVIEEPPSYAVIIFLLPSSQSLLSTVRSRCVTFSLSVPEKSKAIDYLCDNTEYNKSDIEKAVLWAQGNIGKAKKYLENGDAEQTVQSAKQLLQMAISRDTYGMLKLLYGYDRDRDGLAELLQKAANILGDEIRGNGELGLDNIKAVKLFDAVNSLVIQNEKNCNMKLLFSNACVILQSSCK